MTDERVSDERLRKLAAHYAISYRQWTVDVGKCLKELEERRERNRQPAKVPDPNLGPVALAHALAQAVGIQLRPLNKWHKISFYAANCGGTLVTSSITFVPVDEKGEPAGHIKAVMGKQEFPV